MSDNRDKIFKQGEIHLSPEDLDTLAKAMQNMPEPHDDSGDSQINRDLAAAYGSHMQESGLEHDPSSLSDDQLWDKIQAATTGRPIPIKRKNRQLLKVWAIPFAAAAAALLILKPWAADPDPFKNIKGIQTGEQLFRSQGCALAIKAGGDIIELDIEGIQLPASTPVLFLVRCQRNGYLHVRLEAGQEHVNFDDIKVAKSDQWLEAEDQNHQPIGALLPESGTLQLTYGMSEEALMPQDKWLWIRQLQWPIRPR